MATAVLGARQSRGRSAPRILRAGVMLLIATVVFAFAGAAWLYWRAHACLPQLDGTIVLPGIAAPVEVLRDAQGVPHLRAQSLNDLMFVQGYVTAQDRLWQMDLSRRLARGELSEIFGKRTLEHDIENRKLGLSEAADHGVNGLDPASRRVLAAYARGVNAFIAGHLNHLPIEFVLLHYRPQPWREADSIGVALNMAKTLNSSWRTDVMRKRIRRKLPADLYADLFPDRSPLDHPVAEPVSGPIKVAHPDATGALTTAGLLHLPVHLPATSAPLWDPPIGQIEFALLPHQQNLSRLDPTLSALLASDQEPDLAFGSNNWVLSGAHTRSGKPLLVNDPHLGHSIPSVWYEVELEAPELHATGVSLPGGPLVIIGHNEHIAWGMTNTGPDVQDIYLETFKPEDPRKYLVKGRWVDAEMRQEHIKVRESSEVDLTVKSTRHGPVIGEASPYAMALKWTALQPHAITFAFLKIDRARNWQEFTEAIRQFTGPQQNMVYADVEGNIAYYAPGWVPIRASGDGSLPVRGDTDEQEWLGYVPFEDLPHSYNPPGGIIVTANSRVVPDGYPYFLTHTWAAPWRTARIFQMLEAGANFDVESMLRIDMDVHSLEDIDLAHEVLKAAGARPPDNPEVRFAVNALRDWDGNATADSKATLICEVTRSILLDRILRPKLGDGASQYHWVLGFTFVENAVRHNWTRWLPPDDPDFNMTLMRSLETAVQRVPQLVGSRNPRDWNWGKTIPLTFHHPLDRLPVGKRIFDVGPFIQAGTGTTVKATTSLSGPSMRMVVDFSDLDNSVNNITLGESGQVFSPHYRDQFPAWYAGHSFPMLFSDAAVSKGAVHRLRFLPLE
jgi:penicillin G amidase